MLATTSGDYTQFWTGSEGPYAGFNAPGLYGPVNTLNNTPGDTTVGNDITTAGTPFAYALEYDPTVALRRLETFINGVLINSSSYNLTGAYGTSLNTTGDLEIGNSSWNLGQGFNGTLDAVRISDTALAPSELLTTADALTPEPASIGVLAAGAGMLMLRRQRALHGEDNNPR